MGAHARSLTCILVQSVSTSIKQPQENEGAVVSLYAGKRSSYSRETLRISDVGAVGELSLRHISDTVSAVIIHNHFISQMG